MIVFFISFLFLIFALFKYKNQSGLIFIFYVAFLFWMKYVSFEEISLSFFNKNVLIIFMLSIIALVFKKMFFLPNLKIILNKNNFNFILITGFLSSFLNNITVMSSLINVIKQNKRNLIFLSYLTILGGTTTLIGTSTNIVANQIIQDKAYLYLGFKHFFYIGVPTFLITSLFLYIFLSKFKFKEELEKEDNNKYFIEAKIEKNSPLSGKSIKENKLRHLDNLFLAEIIRNKEVIIASEYEILQENDKLIFVGETSKVSDLSFYKGLTVFNQNVEILSNNLIEVIISPDSKYIGQSIKDISFRTNYGLPIVAVKRNREKISGKIGNIVLSAGDVLIIASKEKTSEEYTFLNDLKKHEVFDFKKSFLVLFSFLSILSLNVFGFLGLFNGLLILTLSFLFLNIVNIKEIKSINLEFIIIIASGLVISKAFTNLNIDSLISNLIVSFTGNDNLFLLVVSIFFLTLVITEIFSNTVAVSLILPIALSIYIPNLDIFAIILAVVFAANGSFIFPYGYHTNLIAFTKGKFTHKEFMSVGFFTTIIYSLCVLFFIYIFYIIK